MVLTRKATLCFGIAIALIATVMMVSPVLADDGKPADTPKDEVKEAEKDAPEATEEEVDPFQVPDGTPGELIDFMKKVLKMKPKSRAGKDVVPFLKGSGTALVEGAEKVFASPDATKTQCAIASRAKLKGIGYLMMLRDPRAKEILFAYPKQLKDLGLLDMERIVKGQIFSLDLAMTLRGNPDAKPFDEVFKAIKSLVDEKTDVYAYKYTKQIASKLDRAGKSKEAVELCENLIKQLAKSDNEALVKNGKFLKAIARRFDLVGNPIKIVGKTVDGSDFDWKPYKGKVVLVQFWATWCGYCLREIPGIEENYEKYHDKGFEVVGVSWDRSLTKLESYLDRNPVPWVTVYNGPRTEEEEEAQKDPKTRTLPPNIAYYGISGIPQIMLVGRDGKVIATNLRGGAITKALEKIFGPADEKSEDTAEAPEAKKE